MSTLALMRWLESSPVRYDRGMTALTLGRVARLHDAVAEAAAAEAGCHVLEIGCGTGAVTVRLLARGARVLAIDQSPEMLEQARARFAGHAGDVELLLELREGVAAEIDGLPKTDFDAVVLCLCLSEMSPSERRFVLHEAALRLREGGVLVAADEVHARAGLPRLLQRLLRAPQALAGWLWVGAGSRPLPDLAGEVAAAGLRIEREERWLGGTLAMVVGAKRP